MNSTFALPRHTFSHRPGPYSLSLNRDGCDDVLCVADAHGQDITDFRFWLDDSGDVPSEILHTARLFEAAPDLLDMLWTFVALTPEDSDSESLRKLRARAAAQIAELATANDDAGGL